jgi:hypothetical protein
MMRVVTNIFLVIYVFGLLLSVFIFETAARNPDAVNTTKVVWGHWHNDVDHTDTRYMSPEKAQLLGVMVKVLIASAVLGVGLTVVGAIAGRKTK